MSNSPIEKDCTEGTFIACLVFKMSISGPIWAIAPKKGKKCKHKIWKSKRYGRKYCRTFLINTMDSLQVWTVLYFILVLKLISINVIIIYLISSVILTISTSTKMSSIIVFFSTAYTVLKSHNQFQLLQNLFIITKPYFNIPILKSLIVMFFFTLTTLAKWYIVEPEMLSSLFFSRWFDHRWFIKIIKFWNVSSLNFVLFVPDKSVINSLSLVPNSVRLSPIIIFRCALDRLLKYNSLYQIVLHD